MKKTLIVYILLMATMVCLFAQQDFYDINTVNNIYLYFTQSNWDQILDQLYAAGNEERLVGTAIINGVTYDSVGVRYKGNSSYNPNNNKNPFNIKLDYIIDNQNIGPYGTLKLANGFADPSFIRETLSYEIARKYMPASRANYANVYVNDQLIGVYTSVQDVDSYFMNEHFHCSGKPRFKCDTNTMNPVTVWGYLGSDSTAYEQYYQIESHYGWNALINFTNVLQNNPSNIAQVMNVDQNLWMCVFDNLLVNLDSPINVFHNFYLFGDASDRINPLVWDLNMSFGGFQGGSVTQMQQLDPLRNANSNTFLLLKNVLSNACYKKMYIAHMRTMIEENFSNGWYATRGAELQAIVAPYVQADPNFFYSYTNFQSNLNNQVAGGQGGPGGGQSVPGITQLMNARATYLLNNSNFAGTVPSLVSYNHSPETVEVSSTILFTATANNATYMQLGFRQNHTLAFQYYEMFDDGAHSDGAAGDGTFAVSIPVSSGDIEYYFWAENTQQGMFFPARAEFEFYSIPVINNNPSLLYINEIMAKNASFPDPFGEMDDWVELYNPNDFPVNIGGMYMTDSHYSDGISAWTQIPTGYSDITTIAPHSFLVVWFDEDLDQGPLHINDKLGGSADAVYLIDTDGETVIDSYTWTEATDLNVDDRSIGRMPDGGNEWMLFGTGQTSPCTPGASNSSGSNVVSLYINEIMAKNASFPDPFGEMDDWVELYNPNDFPVDIGGMYMTDSHYSDGISAWTQIPTGYSNVTTIAPHSFLVVWFDEDLDQGPLHINDKLGGGADSVYLIDSDGETVIDSYTWTEATDLNVDDRSIGRMPDGGNEWMLFGTGQTYPCTPGASNGGNSNEDNVIPSIPVQLRVYPNPTTNLVNIELKGAKSSYKVKVYNLKGELVKEDMVEPDSKLMWNTLDKNGKQLAQGIYLIQTEVGGKKLTQKICVIIMKC